MKRIVPLFLAALLLTACGKKQAVFPAVNIPQPVVTETAPDPAETFTAAPEASDPQILYAEPVVTEPTVSGPAEVIVGYHDELWTNPEPTAFLGTWCTTFGDIYYVIDENMNYYRCGKNLEPEAGLRFWELSDTPNAIVLRDRDGSIRDTLTAYGTSLEPVLYDAAGNRFKKCEACMNGRYLCLVTDAGSSDQPGGSLYINRILEPWFTDAEVEAMRSTKQLPFRKPFGVDLRITTVQEQADGTLLLNGQWILERYYYLEAWKLVGYNRQLVGSGFAPVNGNVLYLDMYHHDLHDSLSACLDGTPIVTYITLCSGAVDCIEFVEPY